MHPSKKNYHLRDFGDEKELQHQQIDETSPSLSLDVGKKQAIEALFHIDDWLGAPEFSTRPVSFLRQSCLTAPPLARRRPCPVPAPPHACNPAFGYAKSPTAARLHPAPVTKHGLPLPPAMPSRLASRRAGRASSLRRAGRDGRRRSRSLPMGESATGSGRPGERRKREGWGVLDRRAAGGGCEERGARKKRIRQGGGETGKLSKVSDVWDSNGCGGIGD